MRHSIDGEDWIPWGDVEKRYKVTKHQLDHAVRDGYLRKKTLPVRGTPYVFEVYNEADIIIAKANKKFVTHVDVEGWFK
jgi:hypothetical protein